MEADKHSSHQADLYLGLDSQQIECDGSSQPLYDYQKQYDGCSYRGKGFLPDVQEESEDEDEDNDNPQLHCQEYSAVPHQEDVPGQDVEVEGVIRRAWNLGWTVVHFQHLPKWLRDNDFLIKGHRPQLYSVRACLGSIFRIHTETGNIWTHLLGCVAFIGSASYFLSRPPLEVQWREKTIYSGFFVGAICCLFFSTFFHTFLCHSKQVKRVCNKLDYCGIAILTMGSFVPWLYYSFYCRLAPMIAYNLLILVLGSSCIVVSMSDKFAEPKFRPLRAGLFIGLGLSGCIPALHFVITDGFHEAIHNAALGWLVLMAFLYIFGAIIYALRVPERIWPGKFDIWFQSHQIFHMCVVAGAYIHLHGISGVAAYRMTLGDCSDESAASQS